jgi:hypothetical protein
MTNHNAITYEEQLHDLSIKQKALSMGQSTLWGIQTGQSSFPRLKDILMFEEYGEKNIALNSKQYSLSSQSKGKIGWNNSDLNHIFKQT